MDLSTTITPSGSQLNADDLIQGERTFTIERVTAGSAEQPVSIHLRESPGRPWKPSKSMRRVLVAAWGAESDAYLGRHVTLARNPEITYGGKQVGGIEIAAMSHIGNPIHLALTVARGKKRPLTVQPLTAPEPTFTVPKFSSVDDYRAHWTQRRDEGATREELDAIVTASKTVAEGGADG